MEQPGQWVRDETFLFGSLLVVPALLGAVAGALVAGETELLDERVTPAWGAVAGGALGVLAVPSLVFVIIATPWGRAMTV